MELNQSLKTHIVKTLAYADLFDYPMKKEELIKWFISKEREDTGDFLDKVNGVVFKKNGFFYLQERDHIVALRRKRQILATSKFEKAGWAAKYLSLIPTITLIGISGSLSMRNTDENDDIDLFIVTKAKALWLTRLLSVVILELIGSRRRPDGYTVRDKVCLNMFVDEGSLGIPKAYQNMYTAHEVCQLEVLFDRDGTYKRFLKENVWVRKYLPNAISKDIRILGCKDTRKTRRNVLNILISHYLNLLERIARFIQLFYMRLRGRRFERTKGVLRFHPKNYHTIVLKAYEERLRKYGLSV